MPRNSALAVRRCTGRWQDTCFCSNQNPAARPRRACRRPPQSPSASVIQSRAQPRYAGIEPGRKVLTLESPIITFELTDKLAKVRGHIWLYAKEALQTLPYLSANGLIVFCVNDAHACTPMRGTARAVSTVWHLASASVPRSILSR